MHVSCVCHCFRREKDRQPPLNPEIPLRWFWARSDCLLDWANSKLTEWTKSAPPQRGCGEIFRDDYPSTHANTISQHESQSSKHAAWVGRGCPKKLLRCNYCEDLGYTPQALHDDIIAKPSKSMIREMWVSLGSRPVAARSQVQGQLLFQRLPRADFVAIDASPEVVTFVQEDIAEISAPEAAMAASTSLEPFNDRAGTFVGR